MKKRYIAVGLLISSIPMAALLPLSWRVKGTIPIILMFVLLGAACCFYTNEAVPIAQRAVRGVFKITKPGLTVVGVCYLIAAIYMFAKILQF